MTIQAGAMQWMLGDVKATTGIKGVGDFLGKAVRGKATGESAIKPEYTGSGVLVLEPTYKYLILMDAAQWGGGVVLDDGLFLACESTLQHKAVMRSNFSSAVAGGEGLFNLSLNGNGVFCIESECPKEELIEIELQNDVLKVDGNYAIAWSKSLDFTVERSGKSLIGSAASGEGLVNVYRGTGKVLMNFGEEQLKLTPGEQLVLDKTNMHLEREHVNTQNYMLWMQNKLYFNRTPIQEVTRRLERVYNYTIQLDSSFVFNNFLSGTHDNRSLEAVLESIRLATGIKYRKENNSYILYK